MNGQSLSFKVAVGHGGSASWLPASYRAYAVQEDVRCGPMLGRTREQLFGISERLGRSKRSKRHLGVAVVLALAFGPIGLLYSAELGAVISAVVDYFAFVFAHISGLLCAWMLGAFYAAATVVFGNRHNEELL